MTPSDLAALHAACFEDAPRPWTADEFASLLAASGVFLAAGADGFALGREAAGEAELLTLAVRPAMRRQGIGLRLLAAFEASARERGAARAFLEVAEDNVPARSLYGASGWVQAGYRRDYYTAGGARRIGALVLVKDLAPASLVDGAGGSD